MKKLINFLIVIRKKFFLFLNIRIEITKIKRDDSKFYKNYPIKSLDKKAFINVGAGKFRHKFWTNVDYSSGQYAKYQDKNVVNYNLMSKKRMPFKTESIEAIYSAHCIEHISNEAAKYIFKEFYRILKKDGFLRIQCADADLIYNSYRTRNIDYWREVIEDYKNDKNVNIDFDVESLMLHMIGSQTKNNGRFSKININRKFRDVSKEKFLDYLISESKFDEKKTYRHINWFNFEKLEKFAKQAKFKDCFRSMPHGSFCLPMRNKNLFDSKWSNFSIYFEVKK